MIVKTILKSKARGAGIISVPPDASVGDAARLLATHKIGAVLVMNGDRVAGILSERDIVRGLADAVDVCITARVKDLMTAEVFVCHEDDTVERLMEIMTAKRIRHLPVVNANGDVAGIVTIGDVVKSRLDETKMEAESLRDYVMAGR
ncbi:CBS domain-containing protein [Paramagnetospirillum caucaseum]|uniref:CBS domain-containing protein n=1 Tax=Paramagnetospirillum caucaseum TaxID=1244869 RepID=M2YAK6_9PROT|nr:CBS domain-containing protein [Paramagnetospirillum caucaseum]EME70046.1 CBS domain-containing protein [Paramagnetospirillum caucaseum]